MSPMSPCILRFGVIAGLIVAIPMIAYMVTRPADATAMPSMASIIARREEKAAWAGALNRTPGVARPGYWPAAQGAARGLRRGRKTPPGRESRSRDGAGEPPVIGTDQ